MDKLKTFLQTKPLYVFLLTIFFVMHGFVYNFPFIPVSDGLLLISIYFLATLLFYFLSWLFLKDLLKSAIFVFALMLYNFFFGVIQDSINNIFTGSFLSRYSFVLIITFFGVSLLFYKVKKRKKNLLKTTLFLNLLFLCLISLESILLIYKNSTLFRPSSSIRNKIASCDTCSKPDIYLIIADEYAGKKTLSDLFEFNNSKFETDLSKRGFHIIKNSISNYHFSPFSIASMLDQHYLEGLHGSNSSAHDMNICFEIIKQNNTFHFLLNEGYKLYNCSIFDFDHDPSIIKSIFLPVKTKPIISQTFTYRIIKDLGYHLATNLNLKFARNSIIFKELKDNVNLYNLTKKTARTTTTLPKFAYTHFLMPHYPYYFDGAGNSIPIEKINPENWSNKNAYVEYLQYTNTKLLQLIDYIKTASSKPPVIILMSDHGFRQYTQPVDSLYNFLNLNAIFFPDGNYKSFYNNMSNINQFRVILNSHFNQNFPLLKDSISILSP